MRQRDHKDTKRHLDAMDKIKPLFASRLVVRVGDGLQTMRLHVPWNNKLVRVGLVIGGLVDGEPHLSETGMLCVDQWTKADPAHRIHFVEFKQVTTGNLSRLTSRIVDALNRTEDDMVLYLGAKNPIMYDKIAMILGIGALPSVRS